MNIRNHSAELREDAEQLETERSRIKVKQAARMREAAAHIETLDKCNAENIRELTRADAVIGELKARIASLEAELEAYRSPHAGRTVFEAREQVSARLCEGSTCEVCGQNAQSYKRPIHKMMAKGLVALYCEDRRNHDQFLDIVEVTKKHCLPVQAHGGDFAKLRFWGLVEPADGLHELSNSNRTGYWRITPLGRRFVQGEVSVAKRARVYNNECLDLDDGETITIAEALKEPFDYREIIEQ